LILRLTLEDFHWQGLKITYSERLQTNNGNYWYQNCRLVLQEIIVIFKNKNYLNI